MAISSSSTFLTSSKTLKLLPSLSPLLRFHDSLSLSPPISSLRLLPPNKNYFCYSPFHSLSSFAFGGKKEKGGIGDSTHYSYISAYKEEEEEVGLGVEEYDGSEGKLFLDTVPYQKELVNRARVIGTVPYALSFIRFDSGKRRARGYLIVRSPSGEKIRFVLEFWDELAEIAATHIKESDEIYVDGRLFLESFLSKDNVQKTICKVTAQDFKFVHGFPSNLKGNDSSPKFEERKLLTAKLWQEYFADPSEWWDNRAHKKNPRAPDFKHKTIEEAIWIDDQTPEWALQQLQILDSGPKPWHNPRPSVSFQNFDFGDI